MFQKGNLLCVKQIAEKNVCSCLPAVVRQYRSYKSVDRSQKWPLCCNANSILSEYNAYYDTMYIRFS